MSMRKKRCIWLFVVLLLTVGCKEEDVKEKPSPLVLEFKEVAVLNGGKADSGALHLTSPKDVKVDNEGRIYVSDTDQLAIKVFDQKGNFIQSIGREGKGPGEFNSISAFAVNDGKLIAVDGRNRRIIYFDSSGNVLKTVKPNKDAMVWPGKLYQLSPNKLLINRKKPSAAGGTTNFQASALHIFDENFETRFTSFAHVNDLMNANNEFVKLYNVNINAGHAVTADSSRIYFVPGIYDGHIYEFQKQRNGWVNTDTLNGSLAPDKAYTLVNNSNSLDGTIQFTVFSGGGPYIGKINSESLALFTLDDGRLVHFSAQIADNKRETKVEIFDQSGNMQGVGQLNDFSFSSDTQQAKITSIWKDDNNRFYVIDTRNNPTVRIGQIEGLNDY